MSAANFTGYQSEHTALSSYVNLNDLYLHIRSWSVTTDDVLYSVRLLWYWSTSTIVKICQSLPQHLTWSHGLNLVLLILILANLKSVPFVHHLRLLNGVRHLLISQRSPKPLTPAQLFQPLITSSRAPLMEMDVYGHKSNSTYFSDHDIARTHLLTTMFSKGIEKIRGSLVMNGLSGKKRSAFRIPLGAVTCSFRKELKPYEAYDMWTRILSWDEKWIYVVTHFVKRGAKIEPEEMTLYPSQSVSLKHRKAAGPASRFSVSTDQSSIDSQSHAIANSPVVASAVSKLVFKDGRRTIAPETMLEAAGLLPQTDSSNQTDSHLVLSNRTRSKERVAFDMVDQLANSKASDSVSDSGSVFESMTEHPRQHLYDQPTREIIEAERVRGLSLAGMLAGMAELEHEFRTEAALGRHYDGLGIEGVVATLLQLGKVSKYQLI